MTKSCLKLLSTNQVIYFFGSFYYLWERSNNKDYKSFHNNFLSSILTHVFILKNNFLPSKIKEILCHFKKMHSVSFTSFGFHLKMIPFLKGHRWNPLAHTLFHFPIYIWAHLQEKLRCTEYRGMHYKNFV